MLRLLRVSGWVLVLLTVASAAWVLLRTIQSGVGDAEQIAQVQQLLRDSGMLAPVAYVLFVTAEVIVAPLPGLLLYIPGGLLFGPLLGGLLALIGNILGAGIACSLARRLGAGMLARMDPDGAAARLQSRLQQRGFWVVLLLRLNPLTSSDLVSYAAGLTRMPVWQVMTATGIGIAPLCFLQSWLSDSLFTRWPGLFWLLLIATPIWLGLIVVILLRMARR
ncbi:MAG: TVP38/TMEM64 family protein [Planctomyces sp.]|jgi:uncharacterized membrane protein YdjX (TVP38/TMEM64 family)